MPDAPEKVKMSSALEYAAFTRTPVLIQSEKPGTFTLRAFVHSVAEDHFVVAPHEATVVGTLEQKSAPLTASLVYRARKLAFQTTLITTSEHNGGTLFTLELPKHGTLSTARNSVRATLLPGVKTTLTVETLNGTRLINVARAEDLSTTSVRLLIPRAEALVLLGDTVTQIEMRMEDVLALSASGIVARIKPIEGDSGVNAYDVVVAITGASEARMSPTVPTKEERKASRLFLDPQAASFVRFNHPLFPEKVINANLLDISTSGFSFSVDTNDIPILPGLTVGKAELYLPKTAMTPIQFKVVQTHTARSGDSRVVRVGARFTRSDLMLLKRVNALVQKQLFPNLADAVSADQNELWSLFFESGFIYSEKREQIQDKAHHILDTMNKLLSSETPLLKKILYKEESKLVGHVSAIKFFDKTWIVQHLNAIKTDASPNAAKTVLRAITQFFLEPEGNHLASNQYAIFYYRPNNLYPALVFGEARNFINRPDICDVCDLEYCLAEPNQIHLNPSKDAGFETREATAQDLSLLEATLVRTKKEHLLRIEGLNRENILQMEISKSYEKIGLYRKRRVFVAQDKKSGLSAFAVCNYASPGINFSELTNTFRIFYSAIDLELKNKLAAHLMNHVLESYRSTQLDRPILLAETGDPVPAPFKFAKTYRYWYLNTRYTNLFKDSTDYVFENFRQLVAKITAKTKDDSKREIR